MNIIIVASAIDVGVDEKKPLLNTFLANVLILYPLNTPENLWFSIVFRGVFNENMDQEWVKLVSLRSNDRSSHSHMLFKIGVLINFAVFTGKRVCWSLFHAWTCFPVNIEKFLKTVFFIEHLWWLLLGKVMVHYFMQSCCYISTLSRFFQALLSNISRCWKNTYLL